GNGQHRTQVGQARPQPIERAHVCLVQLSRARGPEALARTREIPDVEVGDLGPFEGHDAENLSGSHRPRPSRPARDDKPHDQLSLGARSTEPGLEVVNLDDASPQTGKWDGAVEAENANKAVGDPLAIVYIGTYNSGAAKVSIPITNRAHMAQVTPANTYPGLTKKRGAAPGEPEIYRPGGFVNYFRPIPADDIQGAVGAK